MATAENRHAERDGISDSGSTESTNIEHSKIDSGSTKTPRASEPKPITDHVWKHNQDLTLKNLSPYLHTIKDALQKTIDAEKAKLASMIGTRDSIKK